ncbi:flagellar hook-length control protein FliK [Shewanella sp. D64]|uniref:flagellar hook-length control protein FliK n=1 Tax=unclassified Shewanella TaxID=196818 RepID=UPI0022BA1741|nr:MULTISPECIES: flagellar hook-length control protein FliK [unclassified Shewanella]MEC4725938.1 flagellar hook-length control protein FliK [Shewanella sp. D64]MEC4737193.1 flagellar hook-length control protein FliK [Shewanella sp. E94]WBJ95615.1 flagellar hook-length control protein FliK [Shewanella sp. MTB7]
MISNTISSSTTTYGANNSPTINAKKMASASESSSETPYAMFTGMHFSQLNKADTSTILQGADTHIDKATSSHLVNGNAPRVLTAAQDFQLNSPAGIPTQSQPRTATPQSQNSANLSLPSSPVASISSPTTSLPIAKHLVTPPLNVQPTRESFTSLGLPLALTDPKAMEFIEGSNSLLASNTRAQTQVSQWGPVSVTPSAPQAQQAQELLSPLREQLRFQIDQQIKKAEIRLDPPELGKVELSIRLDGDRLHIQMHAANASVRDSLLIGLERLRAELAMDHGGQIDVDIGQGEKEQEKPNFNGSNIAESKQDNLESHNSQNKQRTSSCIDLLA